MNKKNIVMLVGKTRSSGFMYHGLAEDFQINKVIVEDLVSIKQILKNRAKRIGYFNVFGQILFGVLLLPIIKKMSKKRQEEVISKLKLNTNPIPSDKVINVSSVNSEESMQKLKELKPDIVIVNGCRIVSSKILNSIPAIFVNMHEGITPRYRGIHGSYWALANKDEEHCGVTVHFVDKGVDTGGILYQGISLPEKEDNFSTYPLYQTAKGISLMKKAITDIQNNESKVIKSTLESKIWYHPTIWQYLYYRMFRGVK